MQSEINEINHEANALNVHISVSNAQDEIAKLAYFKAESRGFVEGYELGDWLEAEQEYHLSQL